MPPTHNVGPTIAPAVGHWLFVCWVNVSPLVEPPVAHLWPLVGHCQGLSPMGQHWANKRKVDGPLLASSSCPTTPIDISGCIFKFTQSQNFGSSELP